MVARETSSISGSTPVVSNEEVYHIDAEKRSTRCKGVERGMDDTSTDDAPTDSNLVTWDGPDDPKNPLNWTNKRKITATASIALITFITPLGSSMFAPGVKQLVEEFNITSVELSSFVVSVYLLGYCFGPLVLAPISEIHGRRIVYNVCNVLYVVWSVACAVAPNIGALTVFRFFAGVAGSCSLTIGAGSIADMFVQEQRGRAVAIWALGPIIGPVIGPVAGGYLSQAKGWRWSFWVLAIASGAVAISSFFSIRESYAPTILERKTKKLQKETGNLNLRSSLDTGRTPKDLFWFSIVRPTKMLFLSPIVFLLSLYVGVIYGYVYLLFTTISSVFEEQYGFSQGAVGLAYLGIGVGSIFGLLFLGTSSDRLLNFLAARNNGVKKPEYRLPPMIAGGVCIPISLFIYGWTAYYKTHWIVPIIGSAFLGLGMLLSFMTISTYLVDAYTIYAASAMAANTVFRSLAGAMLPLAGPKMYERLGLGWGNSLLGFIALALCPLPLIFYIYGERIRTSKRFRVEL
ncbi:hypothetical protein N7492_003773 [Penicillium capsulatum]|uniref:Major facilitator superfamily (MFS) profile domain-containing protein n=1 Tax=Penicillium capsulatum TaxID=69766 RepID=A0A9W9LWI4_9EURO|nr:hypothetical protein N7492_003773 [Penicillium capsulatum]KAJ6121645.1 hypothetical protein N7512_004110 [Penicillium capsulatum]